MLEGVEDLSEPLKAAEGTRIKGNRVFLNAVPEPFASGPLDASTVALLNAILRRVLLVELFCSESLVDHLDGDFELFDAPLDAVFAQVVEARFSAVSRLQSVFIVDLFGDVASVDDSDDLLAAAVLVGITLEVER